MQVAFNGQSNRVFDSLPPSVAAAITDRQRQIEEFVLSVCPNAVATSGFRDARYNAQVSNHGAGHEFSLHLHGSARDYSLRSVDGRLLGEVASRDGRYRVVIERNCVHVQMAF